MPLAHPITGWPPYTFLLASLQSSRLFYAGCLGEDSEQQALQHKGGSQRNQQVLHDQRGQRPRHQCLLQLSVMPGENGSHRCGLMKLMIQMSRINPRKQIY